MRSLLILRKQLEHSLVEVHKSRRESVWRAVEALIVGRQLYLTALGRSMSGQTSDKHRIKAADRLLGNPAVQDAVRLFYRALACQLLRHTPSPVVAVDWTGASAEHYVLSAQLCFEGRALPLYDQVFPREHVGNQRFHEQFLRELATVIPPGCKPVVVTDAGVPYALVRRGGRMWLGLHWSGTRHNKVLQSARMDSGQEPLRNSQKQTA